jgi:hypothetical protein
MSTSTPDLLKQVEALALRRNVSNPQSSRLPSHPSCPADTTERLEAAMSRRLDKLGRQIDMLDEDVAILGETLSLFVQFWLTITPPLPDSAKQSARIKGNERFEGFMQTLGKRLASGDRFLKELSRDIDSLHDLSSQGQSEADGNQL